MNTVKPEVRYIPAKETAKMIRADLAQNFPGTKFSVRCQSITIRIEWVDGPSESSVKAVTDKYRGTSFDGMTDLTSYNNYTLPTGEMVHFCTSIISLNREYSREYLQAIIDHINSANLAWTDGEPDFKVDGFVIEIKGKPTAHHWIAAQNQKARFGWDWSQTIARNVCNLWSADEVYNLKPEDFKCR